MAGYSEISANPGAYFKNINNIHVYEQTTPIIYTVSIAEKTDLENIRRKFKLMQNENQIFYDSAERENIENMLTNIEELEEMNTEILKEFEMRDTPKRRKRGLQFVGDTLAWCCNVLTVRDGREIIKNELSLKAAYDKTKEVLLEHHAALLNISSELKDFSNKATKQIQNLHMDIMANKGIIEAQEKSLQTQKKMQEIYEKMNIIFSTHAVMNMKMGHMSLSCKNNNIPSIIVKRQTLKRDLERVKIAAELNNLELAIDINNINLYYHTKIVTCATYGSNIEIEIKVPLRKIASSYTIHKYIPITFKSHDNKLCGWDQEPAVLILEDRTGSIHLSTGTDLAACNTQDPICHVPQGREANNRAACAAALFRNKPYEELIRKCAMKCEPNHGNTIIKQLGNEQFAITNIKRKIKIMDRTKSTEETRSINSTWPGTTIVKIPCELELKQEKEDEWDTIIPAGIPCAKNVDPQIQITHHLPIVWARVGDIDVQGGLDQSFRFRNMTTAYDVNWAKKNALLYDTHTNQRDRKKARKCGNKNTRIKREIHT